MNKKKNILFLCTGNSARSILGESIFNSLFTSYGHAFSAGSRPAGQVNPAALETLKNHGHDVRSPHSKHIGIFSTEDAPAIDLVISVCDNAAEDCPIWKGKGHPQHLHWPLPDPAAVEGVAEKSAAFERTYSVLKEKISDLVKSFPA